MRAAYYESVGSIIESVGSGVDAARIGERVWTRNVAWKRPFGTCAKFVCLPTEPAVALPRNIDFEAGACLGIPAMTACHAALGDGSLAGKTVLVTGGAAPQLPFYPMILDEAAQAHVAVESGTVIGNVVVSV